MQPKHYPLFRYHIDVPYGHIMVNWTVYIINQEYASNPSPSPHPLYLLSYDTRCIGVSCLVIAGVVEGPWDLENMEGPEVIRQSQEM